MAIDSADSQAELSAATIGIAVLDGIGDQLVQHQPDRRRFAGDDLDLVDRRRQLDVRSSARSDDIIGEVGGKGSDVEPRDVVGLVQAAVHRRQRVDPLEHVLQRLSERWVGQRARLQPEQRPDHVEVVLDPVIDLVEQGRLGFERRLEVGGAGMDDGLDQGLLLDYPILGFDPFGDIELRGEEILDGAVLTANRADVQRIPERRAILAVVEHVDVDRLLGCDRGSHLGDGDGVGVLTLQEAAVASDDLGALVTGQRLEGLVGKHDRVIRLSRIGDHHRHPGTADRCGERIATARFMPDDFSQMPIFAFVHAAILSLYGEADPPPRCWVVELNTALPPLVPT